MADMDCYHIRRVALVYLYLNNKRRRRQTRRRVWVHHMSQGPFGEFHRLLQELRLDEGRFQWYFRLSTAQFDDLLSRIGARITHQDTNYRRSISAAERLSVCLRYLATGDSYRTIATSYRVGVSTVAIIIPEVLTAIWDGLVEDFMAVPSAEDWRSIAEEFHQRWNFPNCCGAVDGKHVILKVPPNLGSQLHNCKGPFSVVLLAVVDALGRFRVIDVGDYGRTSDGGILANSTLGQALRCGTLNLPPDHPFPGAEQRGPQPHVFVADEAFPLRRNMMRPFPGRALTPERRIFNYRLSRARLVVEDTFGLLFAQWRLFRRLVDVRPEVLEKFVKTTCLLHNFIRSSASEAPVEEAVATAEEPLRGLGRLAANNFSREAYAVRETFMAHFTAEGAVTQQPAE
uniref:DDE Tnp4 domain-containing protein n=1 Tax=Oryzias latipes TaxID=8090 RepID=A0A3P9LIS6_ORYLA